MKYLKFIVVAVMLAASLKVSAQLSMFTEIDNVKKVSDQLKAYSGEMTDLYKAASKVASVNGIDGIEKALKESDFRYGLFFQTNSADIAQQEKLQSMVIDYQTLRQTLVDSLAVWRSRLDARDRFESAEAFLATQDSTYKAMYRLSAKLSLAPQTAKALEKLKAREQLKFAAIQSNYDQACSAVQVDPSLEEFFEPLEENYIELKSYSVKIQQAAYKPFIDRIKDYLLSIAAVTIVLMFFVMIKGQISAAKQYRDNMKKMAAQFKKNDNEIPSI